MGAQLAVVMLAMSAMELVGEAGVGVVVGGGGGVVLDDEVDDEVDDDVDDEVDDVDVLDRDVVVVDLTKVVAEPETGTLRT